MPISPALVTHAEVVMKGLVSAGGGDTTNTQFVFHYRRTATTGTLDKSALSAAFQAGPAVPIIAALNARWSQKSNDVRWIDDATDQHVPFANVNAGAIAGDSLSSGSSVYVLLRTGLRGRSYRGGKHFGPFSESDVTALGDDILNAAAITRVTAIMTALAAALVDGQGNTWKLCVFAKSLSTTTTNPTTIVTNDVTTILLNKRISSMKRRLIKSVY